MFSAIALPCWTPLRSAKQVREAYIRYRGKWDLARHHADRVLPLRKTILDLATLQYNGMLADAGDRVRHRQSRRRAMHCHKSHHTMNAMGHQVRTTIGANMRTSAKEIARLVPGYMPMGTKGMAGMADMAMRLPENTLSMI